MSLSELAARDAEPMNHRQDNGQDWIVSWHPPAEEPAGTNHGSAGICLTNAGDLVLVRWEGGSWMLPAGRPEPGETWEETLRREVMEEACAVVTSARLLGFGRSECVRGEEQGKILVRAFWRAEVELLPWEPSFEMVDRQQVPALEAVDFLRLDEQPVLDRVVIRAFVEAGLESKAS